MSEYLKTKKGYFYKLEKNGDKKRISQEEYNKKSKKKQSKISGGVELKLESHNKKSKTKKSKTKKSKIGGVGVSDAEIKMIGTTVSSSPFITADAEKVAAEKLAAEKASAEKAAAEKAAAEPPRERQPRMYIKEPYRGDYVPIIELNAEGEKIYICPGCNAKSGSAASKYKNPRFCAHAPYCSNIGKTPVELLN